MTTEPLRPHPLADLFPRLNSTDYQSLCEDVAANGLLNPIVMHEGLILDGRNRYGACLVAKAQPRFVEFDDLNTGMDPLDWVRSQNLTRRHLTTGQRAEVALRLEEIYRRRQGVHGATSRAAGEAMVSRASIHHARPVFGPGATASPALQEAVRDGGIALAQAAQLAELPAESQDRILTEASDLPVRRRAGARQREIERERSSMLAREGNQRLEQLQAQQPAAPTQTAIDDTQPPTFSLINVLLRSPQSYSLPRLASATLEEIEEAAAGRWAGQLEAQKPGVHKKLLGRLDDLRRQAEEEIARQHEAVTLQPTASDADEAPEWESYEGTVEIPRRLLGWLLEQCEYVEAREVDAGLYNAASALLAEETA